MKKSVIEPKQNLVADKVALRFANTHICRICETEFKAFSRFDLLCNGCWADNEMKPYYPIVTDASVKNLS